MGLKQATLTAKEYINKAQTALLLTLKPNTTLDFKPGQFISIHVAENKYRAYSIVSSPNSSNEFQLVISVENPGLGADYLKSLKLNDYISYVGPSGRFYLNEELEKNIVFIATGTGIAPFISMLHTIKNTKLSLESNLEVLFGLRTTSDLYFEDILENFKKELDQFNYAICLSKEEVAPYKFGRVTSVLKEKPLQNTQFYICGNPNMVEEVKEYLSAQNVPSDKVYYEKFTASDKQAFNKYANNSKS